MTKSIYYNVVNYQIVEVDKKPESAVITLKKIAVLMQSSRVADDVKQQGIAAAIAIRDSYAKKVAGLSWLSRWLFNDMDAVNDFCLQSMFGIRPHAEVRDRVASLGLGALKAQLPRSDLKVTWLFMAVSVGFIPFAKYLIQNGSDINRGRSAGPTWEACSPLLWAISGYQLNMMQLLLQNGAATDYTTDTQFFSTTGGPSDSTVLVNAMVLIEEMEQRVNASKALTEEQKKAKLKILEDMKKELANYSHQTYQPGLPQSTFTPSTSSSKDLSRVPNNGFDDSVL